MPAVSVNTSPYGLDIRQGRACDLLAPIAERI
jgi:hypothetical protein